MLNGSIALGLLFLQYNIVAILILLLCFSIILVQFVFYYFANLIFVLFS